MSKGKARDYIPALRYGHKIYPNDIAGMIGLPYVGDVYYIDPTNGSDSNDGKSYESAFATVGQYHTAATSYNHDVGVIVSGGSAGTSEAAGITWSKHYTHLIGNAAPTHVSPRARMLFTTDATDPCLTISANGCIFSNIQIATYQASNDVLVTMTGARNYFNNVHFAGIGNATAGDDATARCFVLNDCDESRFVDCTFGLDTVARSTTNALVESVGASGSERHLFQGCRFMSYADNAGALFVKFNGAYSAERYMIFEDCIFHNSSGAGATTMTVAMDTAASLNGTVFLKNSWLHGATDWADDFTNVYLSMGKPDTDEGGIMVIAT